MSISKVRKSTEIWRSEKYSFCQLPLQDSKKKKNQIITGNDAMHFLLICLFHLRISKRHNDRAFNGTHLFYSGINI